MRGGCQLPGDVGRDLAGTYCYDMCPVADAVVGVQTVLCMLSTSPVVVDDVAGGGDVVYSQFVVSALIHPSPLQKRGGLAVGGLGAA